MNEVIDSGRSSMSMRNNRGPTTEPCGRSGSTGEVADSKSLAVTNWVVLYRKC